MLFSDAVEALKNQYTDKYVKVDAGRPELARFRDAVGQVKTVNMSGRALVQFLDYHLNIGWFDIDPSCLTVVDKPSEDVTAKAEPKRAHDKPAGKAAPTAGDKQVKDAAGEKKKLSPLEMARAQGAAGAAKAPAAAAGAPAGKKSTADILAAARGGAAPSAKADPKAKTEKTDVKGAAAPAATEAKPAKVDRSKMSVAEMLAAARGQPAAPAETAAAAAVPQTPAAAAPPATMPPAPAEPAAAAGGVVKIDWKSMSTADKIAYCRAKDTK